MRDMEITYYFKKQDEVVDISMLGIYYPFEMVDSSDKAFKATILAIERGVSKFNCRGLQEIL